MKRLYLWTLMHPEPLARVFRSLYAAQKIDKKQAFKIIVWNDLSEPPPRKAEYVTLVLGSDALNVLKLLGEIPKSKSIKQLRGQPLFTDQGGGTFVSYSPKIIDRDHSFLPEIQWDGVLAYRFLLTGSIEPVLGTYREIKSLIRIVNTVKKRYAKTGKPVPLNHDLETLGKDPWAKKGRVICSIWSFIPGKSYVYYIPESGKLPPKIRAQYKWLLTTKMVSLGGSGHKYDSHWTNLHWKIDPTNFKVDTVLIGSLINENRSNSLNLLTKTYVPELGGYDDEFNRTYDKGRMDLVPKKEITQYGGGDGDATTRVRRCVVPELRRDRRLLRFYQRVLHPASVAFEKVERRGVVVDLEEYKKLRKQIGDKHSTKGYIPEKLEEFRQLVPKRLVTKYSDNLMPTRPVLVRDIFFHPKLGYGLKPHSDCLTEKTKLPSTSLKHHLIRFYDDERARPMIDVLREYNAADKTRSTYIDGWLKHIRSDGKLHPEYFLFKGVNEDDSAGGANTGRTSAKNPAWQTLPKHTFWAKPLRKCFPAPPGMVILQWDFSQGELRIAACLANEPTMLDAYRHGKDLHCLTAAQVNGMSIQAFMKLKKSDPEQYGLMRSRGKAGNFGLLYGMGVHGFILYAFGAYGIVFTYHEAAAIRDGFFGLYSRLPLWHERQRAQVRAKQMVRSPLGRIRHLPMIRSMAKDIRAKAERQAINSPVQSTLSDLTLWSIVEIEKEFGHTELQIIGMTHDSILGYAPEEKAEEMAVGVKDVMENLPIRKTFGWEHQIPFPVDCEWSDRTLANLEKMAA